MARLRRPRLRDPKRRLRIQRPVLGFHCWRLSAGSAELCVFPPGLAEEGLQERLRNGEFSFYGSGRHQDHSIPDSQCGSSLRICSISSGREQRVSHLELPERARSTFAGRDTARENPSRRIPTIGDLAWALAYTPAFLKKTVIRAGSAITYGNFRQWEISLFHFVPPFVYENFYFNDAVSPSFTTATLWPAVSTDISQVDFRTVTANYQSPDKVIPITYQWNFNVQHELLPNLLVEVGYVGQPI